MSIGLRQLLADPDLGLDLVAGAGGLGRTDPIRWAHISEIPDPTPWLEGGELLLTTGLAVKDDVDLQRALIAGLDGVGCPAVGFGVGIWLDAVPPAMLDEADRRGLPLFTVPYEVPFIAVTRYVVRRVFEAHDLGLRRALDLHRRMLAAVTSGGGIDEVLAVTARAVAGVDMVLFDAFGHVLAEHSVADGAVDPARLLAVLPPRPRARMRFVLGDRIVTAAPVRAADEIEAVLAIVSRVELDDSQMLLVEQAVSAAAVALSGGVSARAQRRATVTAMLDDARTGRAGTNQLADRLAGLGLDPGAPYHVLAVAAPPGTPLATVCRVVEDAAGGDTVAAGPVDDIVHVVVQPATAAVGRDVIDAARARVLGALRVGRSNVQDDVGGLATALREAEAAVAHADGGVEVDVGALGVSGFLAGAGATEASDAFVERMLGPLLQRDEGSPALIASLRAYLEHGCRPGPAAAELRIHRHTLAYRLDRVTALTGRDPRDGQHLVSYGVALELLADAADTGRVIGV